MEKLYTKDEIIAKAREIAHMIANTEQVEFFKRAEAQINENQKIREKIASLKSLQTQAVNFQAYEKERALAIIEGKIEKIQEEIDEVPIVQEFKQSQVEVNDLLQLVSTTIANSVTDEIIESTGGNVLKGETGSYVENTQRKSLS
ncbi:MULTISPECIES: RicAFT regulatory complex protein RicA family protein [Sporosarcina]|uniref:RicAFT regulatory complex protein RicA family protein n=1 Tax=Sporosarcina contaminans TaxID=633403 RepID=A0ABW3TUN1_9BACL